MTGLPALQRGNVEQGLSVSELHKSFGNQTALKGVAFNVAEYEIVALLGPSGCGKSTVLAIIAGLEQPDQGDVFWNGVSLNNVATHQRNFGLMFQDFALFPHQNVSQNIAFGLKMKGETEEKKRRRVAEVLELVGLPGFQNRDVNTLSGGEAQRVALARSLAPFPRMLMLDEPLGSLDRNLRERLMTDLRRILRSSRQTAIYVTHDQEEAFSIADKIVLMEAGKVVQIGSPQEIYRNPANIFVARFLGFDNLIPGTILLRGDKTQINTPIGSFILKTEKDLPQEVLVLLRPDAVQLNGDDVQKLTGKVNQVSFRGGSSRILVNICDQMLSFDFRASMDLPQEGDLIELNFNPSEAIQIFSE